jgi:DNA invertase Pin-like site-specific DNA recombinase
MITSLFTFTSTLVEQNVTGRKIMAKGRSFVSYLRVSTERQGRSGLGLEAQREAVSQYLNGGPCKLISELVEVESGKQNDRPALAEALTLCRIHGAILLVAKLDRLARNVYFTSSLMESGVEFLACDFPTANRLTIHILAAVAEHEASAISARTKAALAAAKARGVKLGGDRGGVIARHAVQGNVASAAIRCAKADKRAADLLPVIQAIQAQGAASLRKIAAELNERDIPAARGGRWSAVQVRRVLTARDVRRGKMADRSSCY